MAYKLRSGIGCTGDLQASTRVTDEYVARLEHVEHCIEATSQSGLFVNTCAVAWDVDGDCLVTEMLELRDSPAPTPCAMESTVNQHEAHVV
jgi:hypothetical protein